MGSSYLSVELAEKLRVQIPRPSAMQDKLYVPSERVVGYREEVVYLMSPGRPTDIGLQSGKACCPLAGKGIGGMVLLCPRQFEE